MKKIVLYRPVGMQSPPLTCLSVNPTGKRLACGTLDSEIILLDSCNGKPRKSLKGHEGAVSGVSFITKGKGLLSTSWDCTTRRWTMRGAPKENPFLRHGTEVKALGVDSKSVRGAAGARDGEVKVFSVSTLKNLRNLQAHRTDVSGLAFTSDDSKLVTASWDGECKVFDMTSFERIRTLAKQKHRIRALCIAPDDSRVFLGLHNGVVLSIDPESPKDRVELSGHTDVVTSLAVDPSCTHLASGGWDRRLIVWSLESGKKVLDESLLAGLSSLAWAPKGLCLYSADHSGALTSWDFDK
ncbi:MAG: WD40 repeat domain-containing protein [Candidatus Thorarchaeota archaeon]|nr:MAG: WD40 repeat domain-containing protein [Candidatus Thorarchaeota archaeon]